MNPEDEEVIEDWFLRQDIAPGTQKSYTISLRKYSELIGKSPKEIYDEADEEEENGIRPIKTKAHKYLLKYKKHLMESGIAPSTVKLYFYAIKSFYSAHGITLPEIKMALGDIGLEENYGKPLSREDIQKLIGVSNSREKALIYLMALSGMGQQEARDLKIKKFLEAASSATNISIDDLDDLFKFDKDVLKEILTLDIRRKKSSYRYITFIPPEASREIINYLKERCYGRNEKIRVNNINEPIFASKYGGPLGRDSIVTNFRRMGEKAGFKRDKNTYSFWRSHSLRKYFISTVINKRGEKIIADFMAGHKIDRLDRAYWQANPDDLKNHYIGALPYLSLDKAKIRDYDSEEVRVIEEKLKEKDEQIEALTDQFNAIEEINMQLMEIDIQLSEPDTSSKTGYRKRSELLEQRKMLHEKRIKLMAKNNPRLAKLHHEKEVNKAQTNLTISKHQLKKATNEKERKRFERMVKRDQEKLDELMKESQIETD